MKKKHEKKKGAASPNLAAGTVSSFLFVQMKVFDSTLATSAGLVRANQQFSYLVKGVKVPCFNNNPIMYLLSLRLPSQMWMFSGLHKDADSSINFLAAAGNLSMSPCVTDRHLVDHFA